MRTESADDLSDRELRIRREFLRKGQDYIREYLSTYNGIRRVFADFFANRSPFPTRYSIARDVLIDMTKKD